MSKAGILYNGSEFYDSAVAVRDYLQGAGFTTSMVVVEKDIPVASLPRMPGLMDVLVWLSHGGWDGPIIFFDPSDLPFQVIASETGEWGVLKAYFADQMQPGGIYISHSCHSAGSNRYEADREERWVRDIARDMNVYTVGVEGSTAAAVPESAVDLMTFTLTGSGAPQATRVYAPGGTLLHGWSGWTCRPSR